MSNLRINFIGAPRQTICGADPEPGDIYGKAGGQPGVWWVVSVRGATCVVLSIDMEGEITGASRYGLSYFRDNSHRRVGRAEIPGPVDPVWDVPQ